MNSTSINVYITKLEAENAKLKNLLEDKNAVIERLDCEICKLHQKLDIQTNNDCGSEVGSSDEPIYEFYSDSESDSDSVSTPPRKVKRVLSPSYESESESVSTPRQQFKLVDPPCYENEDLYHALIQVAENEKNLHKKDVFKNAAETINNLPFKVMCGEELTCGPRKVKGIGETISNLVEEYITTGKMTRGNFTTTEKKTNSESTNHKMAAAFDKLAKLTTQEEYKSLAYSNAAEIVRNFKVPITSGKKLSEGPQKVKGIGKGIGKMIDEFLTTGEISKV